MCKFLLIGFILVTGVLAQANNLQLIETSPINGFSIFRSGKPDASDMAEFCAAGISEIMVLSGDAEQHEMKYAASCPGLKVVYNEKQDANVPVSAGFLNKFDQWVQSAQVSGKKIAIRCSCGCHRTGRLAAYYQMKYQNVTSIDAQIVMNAHGKAMMFHQNLKPQTFALEDYIKGRPCSVDSKYCVK